MRTMGRNLSYSDDEFLHPLWSGILILISVIILISTICCIRVKCRLQLHALINRLFRRNVEIKDNNSNDEKYSSEWTSIYISQIQSQSSKLYTLVRNIRRANLQKQSDIQHSENDDNEQEHISQISIAPSTDSLRNLEIARKFYASMRHSSQSRHSSSFDSYKHNHSIESSTSSSVDKSFESPQQARIHLFRAPHFFLSIPHQDTLVVAY